MFQQERFAPLKGVPHHSRILPEEDEIIGIANPFGSQVIEETVEIHQRDVGKQRRERAALSNAASCIHPFQLPRGTHMEIGFEQFQKRLFPNRSPYGAQQPLTVDGRKEVVDVARCRVDESVAEAASTGAVGSRAPNSAARISVVECPSVNAVTIQASALSVSRLGRTVPQRPPAAISGAGRSSASRNSR